MHVKSHWTFSALTSCLSWALVTGSCCKAAWTLYRVKENNDHNESIGKEETPKGIQWCVTHLVNVWCSRSNRWFSSQSHPLSHGCCLAPCVSCSAVQAAFWTPFLCHYELQVMVRSCPNSNLDLDLVLEKQKSAPN